MKKPSIYERDPFTMYLPPEIEEVRGVLFFLTGGGDSRPWIRGDLTNDFEAFAARELIVEIMETYGLAFIGNDNSHYADFFPDQAMLSVLDDFAAASDHPEVALAPLLPFGYSVGGRRAVNFAFNYPDRTIGVYSYKGVIYSFSDEDWEVIRNIPVFLHMGELDTEVGISDPIPPQFGLNRAEGALWAAGIEKGVAHEFNPPMAFMTTWMEELIISRIPALVTPGTIPVLNVIDEESGWLGDLNTFEIEPYAEFQGDDPASASWLPNDETAQGWQTIFH
jgi:pimeloyl-ACP methyl ester carboxylesterase